MYHIHARALGGYKTASDPLELELWVAVSWEVNPGPLMEQWVSALKHWGSYPV